MERKFTDDEIVKAMWCCSDTGCEECPINNKSIMCATRLMEHALDLINRQKAEIERLNKEVDRLSQCVLYHEGQIIDAVEEFAERLKESCFGNPYLDDDVLNELTDNLVKEMKNKLEENNNER